MINGEKQSEAVHQRVKDRLIKELGSPIDFDSGPKNGKGIYLRLSSLNMPTSRIKGDLKRKADQRASFRLPTSYLT